MPQADTKVEEITVAEIVGPQISERTGKLGPYKIKDSKNRRWSVWSEIFEKTDIAIGKTYAAMYTSKPYTFTNAKTGMQQTGTDNTIVSLMAATPPGGIVRVNAITPVVPAPADDRGEDIAINGLFHSHPLAQLAVQGDQATIVKALRTMRLAWREYKKQAAIMPSGDAEFNDEIPF